MTQPQIEIQLIAIVVAVACALPGVFLVLRRMALLSDAVSHSVLLGIVLAYLVTNDLSSPFLVFGAGLAGLATVLLVEIVHRTRLVKEDAAIGLVFPALFSAGVILISRYAGHIHLDTDSVLLGELAFAPWEHLVFADYDLGPQILWVMTAILVVNLTFIILFYKELKLATFDVGLATALGFSPMLLHYGLMTLVSITVVGAFDAVGSILVVALMIVPAATAYLLTDRLSHLLIGSAVFGVFSAVGGYWLAHVLDASIAGAMATMTGIFFGVVFLLAPRRGLVALALHRRQQRWEFAQAMLAIHLFNHEGKPEAEDECRVDHLHDHLRWQDSFIASVVAKAEQSGLVQQRKGQLYLTGSGRQLAKEMIVSG